MKLAWSNERNKTKQSLNIYRFTKTYTDVHFFDVEAEDEQQAREKLCEMDADDSSGRQTIHVSTDLLSVILEAPLPKQ